MVVSRWFVIPMAATREAGNVRLCEGLLCYLQLRCPDFFPVMFHMARRGHVLGKLLLGHGKGLPIAVKNDGTARCGALIERKDDLRH